MVNWLFFSLLSPILWAIGNIIDKFIVTRFPRKPIIFTTFMGIIIGLLTIFIIIFKDLTFPSPGLILLSILAGLLYFFGIYYFFKSLIFEEVSRIIPLWRFGAIFTLILAFLFLNERLTMLDYLAFSLLVVGGFLISTKKFKETFKISKALLFMIISSFILSVYGVLIKYIYSNINYWDGFILIRLGTFFIALLFLFNKQVRSDFLSLYKEMNLKAKTAIISSEILNFLGLLSINYAIFLASISLVTAVTATQSLFTLLFASIVSIWMPNLFKEEIKSKVIILKIIAILLIIFGVWVLSL